MNHVVSVFQVRGGRAYSRCPHYQPTLTGGIGFEMLSRFYKVLYTRKTRVWASQLSLGSSITSFP